MQANKFSCMAVLFSVVLLLLPATQLFANESTETRQGASFKFVDGDKLKFKQADKIKIKKITNSTIEKVKQPMPELSDSIQFNIFIIDRDLSMVNGTTGRADRTNEIEISFSSSYEGGLDKAIDDGFAVTLFHELHHTVRGWTIYGNKFSQGIDIAIINEGLADVFAEIQAGHPHSSYSNDVDFDSWTKEILALPKNANYGEWMFAHPDGREAIGYRTGAYLIKKAMRSSGKSILELSEMSVKAIYEIAGYQQNVES